MCFSQSFSLRALEQFDSINVVDVDELFYIVESYCRQRQLVLDSENSRDNLKTSILDKRADINRLNFVCCNVELAGRNVVSDNDNTIDLDALLGPVYSTKGAKRKNQEIPLDDDDSDQQEVDVEEDELWEASPRSSCKINKKKDNVVSQKEELLRKFLHIKDEYHITDSAIKAMYKFFKETKQSFYSMAAIERVQKKRIKIFR